MQVPYTDLAGQAAAGTIGVGVPDDYQHIQASPDAFGAQVGQADQRLGAGFQQAGEAAFQVSDQYSQTAAANAFAQLRDRATAASWGDPSNPNAGPGLLTLQGDQAMRAYQPTVDKLKAAQADIAATLPPMAARTFNLQAQRFLGDTFNTFDQHRAVAQQQWQVNSLDAQAASAQSAAIANSGDQNAFLHNLADQRNAVITKGSQLGWSADAISLALADSTSKTYAGAVDRLAAVNPQSAWSYYTTNRNNLTGQDQLAVESKLRPALLTWESRTDADRLRVGAVGSGTDGFTVPAAPGAVAPIPPEQRQSLINQAVAGTPIPPALLAAQVTQESGWDAGRTGASGDIGLGQVLPSTAQAPGYGMQGVDPATLRGPENAANNLKFAAQYLYARGKDAGLTDADWNDPAKQAIALRAYNGGGDPNYAQNVLRHVAPGSMPPAAKPFVIGDSIAQGIQQTNNTDGSGIKGASPDAVLDSINAIPPTGLQGRSVVLSSGISNNPDPGQLAVVQQQLDSLKARGVGTVTVMGVGNRPDLAPLNAQLADLAQKNGATFQPIQAGPDGVHPTDYKGLGVAPASAEGPFASGAPAGTTNPAAVRPSLPAMMAQADHLLDPFGQSNPQYIDLVKSRIRVDQSVEGYAQREAEKSNRETLLTAAMGPSSTAAGGMPAQPSQAQPSSGFDGTAPALTPATPPATTGRPTSLDQLFQNPAARAAWIASTPETQRSIMGVIEHNARGEDPPLTPAAQSLYYQLSGMATNDRDQFQQLNLADPQYLSALPHAYWTQLVSEQRRVSNQSVQDAARQETQARALTVLKPDLVAAGFKTDGLKPGTTAARDYDTFVGRLREGLDDFQQANSRRPNDAEVAKIGQTLLMQGTQRGTASFLPWSSDTAVRAFQVDPSQFVPAVPPAARIGIVQAYTQRFGQPPTEGQIAEAFMRQQAMSTARQPVRRPTAATPPASTGPAVSSPPMATTQAQGASASNQ